MRLDNGKFSFYEFLIHQYLEYLREKSIMRFYLTFSIILLFLTSNSFSQDNHIASCEFDSLDGQPIYLIVEESPEYKKGLTEFYKELSHNIKYPNIEDRALLHSKIYFSFVIDKKGKIRNLCFQPNTFYLKKEFTKKLNKWKAGKQRGKKVNVRMLIPIHIRWG